MEAAGYIAAIFIGISLGLIGAGGSILTVPVLVYLFRIDALLATVYSLFVVGISSLVGSYVYLKRNLVNYRVVGLFGLPSIFSVFITRQYLVPALPNRLLAVSGFELSKEMGLLMVFAILMLAAAIKIIQQKTTDEIQQKNKAAGGKLRTLLQGVLVGLITGLIGAGGGFLIIPALVNVLRLPVKTAIGTSLVIVALNSLGGFLFSITQSVINWRFLATIALMAIGGIFLGNYLSTKIPGSRLKPVFGWFILIMGVYIILNELGLKN